MTTGSTTTPRAAAPRLPRIVKKLGTVGCLGLALLFVRPCQTPAAPGGAAARAVADPRGAPATFTVAAPLVRADLGLAGVGGHGMGRHRMERHLLGGHRVERHGMEHDRVERHRLGRHWMEL
jgi:hypothetical protein